MEYLPWSVGVEMTEPTLLASKTACRILGHQWPDKVGLVEILECNRCHQEIPVTWERSETDSMTLIGWWDE